MLWANGLQRLGPLAQKFIKKFCQFCGRPLIEVHYDCGFGNNLYIRGELPGLNWQKGIAMINLGPNYWIWIAPTPCKGPFKVLINDYLYEEGPNHLLESPQGLSITPKFNLRDSD